MYFAINIHHLSLNMGHQHTKKNVQLSLPKVSNQNHLSLNIGHQHSSFRKVAVNYFARGKNQIHFHKPSTVLCCLVENIFKGAIS